MQSAQLVIQFDASEANFEQLILFEELLTDRLSGVAAVDGHDFGSREFNIFILTDTAYPTFATVLSIARAEGLVEGMRAGYRTLEEDVYVPLWPVTSTAFTVA